MIVRIPSSGVREFCASLFRDNEVYLLDTETTGLGPSDEILELAIVDLQGNTLLNTRLKPTCSISSAALSVHRINEEVLRDAPRLADIWSDAWVLLKDRKIVTYNASFDQAKLLRSCRVNGISTLSQLGNWYCAMQAYADLWRQSGYYGSYTWQSLSKACSQQNIDISDLPLHSALGDCLATLRLLKKMAGDEPMRSYGGR